MLRARGELIAACHLDVAAARDTNPWQTAELLRRVQASDTAPGTLASLEATIFELCCQYVTRDATALRTEAQEWLQHVATLLRKPTGLRAHRELLVSAGWLALLIGCVEYDLGMQAAAEATRVAARQLGDEAGHWWNGTWGRLARLDVYLRIQKPRWEVELREGGAEGRSRRWTFDSEAEATAFVERALAAKRTDWKKMAGSPRCSGRY